MQIAPQTIETIQNMTAEKVQAELRTLEEKREQVHMFMENVEDLHPDTYWNEEPYRAALEFANYLNDVEAYLEVRMEELTLSGLVVSFR